jgi:plasmid stability protein
MAINLSIKNVPDELAAQLKARAARNHRSLQGELLAILESVAQPPPLLTLEDVWKQGKRLELSTPPESAEWVREMRDARYGH